MHTSPPQAISRTTYTLWSLSVAWLPVGFLFRAYSGHFGLGFLPFIVWVFSFPVIALAAGITALVVRLKRDASKRVAIILLGLSVVYLLVVVAWFTIPGFSDWIIS